MELDGIVLVHGGHHDSTCWQLLTPLLDAPAIAVDLPGRGTRPADDKPVTFARCVQAVLEDADAAGFERFVAVGHSMGGFTLSRLMLDAPQRLVARMYVGALCPPPGVSAAQLYSLEPLGPDDDPAALRTPMPEELSRAMFGNDMTDEQWAIARTALCKEPTFMFHDTIPSYPGGVPTMYVSMTDDVPVPPAMAEQMIEQLRPDVETVTLTAGHNVMLSQPETLAKVINDFIAR